MGEGLSTRGHRIVTAAGLGSSCNTASRSWAFILEANMLNEKGLGKYNESKWCMDLGCW